MRFISFSALDSRSCITETWASHRLWSVHRMDIRDIPTKKGLCFILIKGLCYHTILIWNKIITVIFENLIVEFHVLYVLNMYINFHSNKMLFTIWLINLFFIHNFRLQKLEILRFVWWHSNWSLIFLKFCKYEGYNKNM